MSHTRTTLISLAAVLTAAAFATTAGAADRTQATTNVVPVRYEKVDFNNKAQVKALYGRLERAAQAACEDDISPAQKIGPDTEARACETDAMAGALNDINQPQLSRLDAKYVERPTTLAINDRR